MSNPKPDMGEALSSHMVARLPDIALANWVQVRSLSNLGTACAITEI